MTAVNAPELVVVIPHHSQRAHLVQAIASVNPWPVIVVDDGPTRSQALPGVDWIRTTGEEGFARAANRGLKAAAQSGYSLVLLLNDDAQPQEGCIEALLSAWNTAESPGAFGPLLEGADGEISGGISLTSWGRIRTMDWTRRTLATGRTPPIAAVSAISGACLLVDSGARFDARYRHGMEDVALCRSLRASGRAVRIVAHARCRHVGGATLHRKGAVAQRHAISGHLLLVGGGWRAPIVVALALAQVVREGASCARIEAVGLGVGDHYRRSVSVEDSKGPAGSSRVAAPS